MKKKHSDKTENISRRKFVKTGAVGAAALMIPASAVGNIENETIKDAREIQGVAPQRTSKDVSVVHSVCLACNARCGVRGVVKNNRLNQLSGNPYHPYNMSFDPIDPDTPVDASFKISSPICGKAIDTPNHVYSPYRILKPLKRAGKRGEGKFEPISWNQLIKEVAEGGNLFSHLGEDRHIQGLGDLISDEPINPEDPSLGPKRNGFVFMTGRLQSGRKEFIDRFVKKSVGSKNRIGHTDICGLGFRMGNWALTGQKEAELKADPKNAEYILVFGANIYEALQPGINTYGAMVAKRSSDKSLSFAIVDPRATKAVSSANDWLPVKPGKDGALAMGMIRYMIDNNLINTSFLTSPNLEESKKRGFGAVSNATHLVICDPSHTDDGAMLRMRHLDADISGKRGEIPVVIDALKNKQIPADISTAGVLEFKGKISNKAGKDISVKSAFIILKENAHEFSLSKYAKICGVPKQRIKKVAKDFSSHGTRAAVTQYHGAGNYVNGTWAAYAISVLNALVGSVSMRGGYLKGGGGIGKPDAGIYDLKNFDNMAKPIGVALSREKASYEKTEEYKGKKEKNGSGYPAKRPWFSFTKGGLSVECLSGIDAQYPYPAKVLFTYLYNPIYSIPGGYRYKETLADTDKVPLHVSMDVAINETNIYADYIIPELTYAEGHYGWLTPHAPAMTFTGIRTPMIKPLTGKTRDGRHFCTETFLIDLAIRLKLPGFGRYAIKDKAGVVYPLFRGEDFYLRALANIAENAGATPAPGEDVRYVEKAYPVSEYKKIIRREEWRKLCRLLSRGGSFIPYEDGFAGDIFKKGISEVFIYNESLGRSINSLTGEKFTGAPTFIPPKNASARLISREDKSYPFSIVTYKKSLHTQSRSLWCDVAMEIQDENHIELNQKDAEKQGFKNGDVARLTSRSNPAGITGIVKTSQLIRPGCIAVSFHFGHSGFGASSLEIKNGNKIFLGGEKIMEGEKLKASPQYKKGLNFNDVARLDEKLGNTPMVDLAGGIPDFSSTRVKLSKVRLEIKSKSDTSEAFGSNPIVPV